MKYMTFNSSCSYCCLADLLELYGVDREDRQLALDMDLPWLFACDEGEGAFLAGAMLQGQRWFDRCLGPLGFAFEEEWVDKGDVPAYLEAHAPCMVGIRTATWKHAVVCTGREEGQLYFLNPHRPGDGELDTFCLTDEELIAALEERNAVGRLRRIGSPRPAGRADLSASLDCLERYRRALVDFCGRERTGQEIRDSADGLFRPLAVDGLAMMELAGERELAEKMRTFQQQAMALFRAGACRPADFVDLALFEEAVSGWEGQVRRRMARAGQNT